MKISKLFALSAIVLAQFSMNAEALPSGGKPSSGVLISTGSKSVIVNQVKTKGEVSWTKFNIAKGETVQFKQPTTKSIIVNRVTGNYATVIDGMMKANGRVVLINNAGITINKTGQVNVGSLIATTSNLKSYSESSAGFTRGTKTDAVISQHGTITVPSGGVVALVAPKLNHSSTGVINAPSGRVDISGGEAFTVSFTDKKVNYSVQSSKLANVYATNNGTINAKGGVFMMNVDDARTLTGSVLNMNGVIDVSAISGNHNSGFILSNAGGKMNVRGTLRARGENGTVDSNTNLSPRTRNINLVSKGDMLVDSMAVLDASASNYKVRIEDGEGGFEDVGHYGGLVGIESKQNLTVKGRIDTSTTTGDFAGSARLIAGKNLDYTGTIDAKGGTVGRGGRVAFEALGGTLTTGVGSRIDVSNNSNRDGGNIDLIGRTGVDNSANLTTFTSRGAGGTINLVSGAALANKGELNASTGTGSKGGTVVLNSVTDITNTGHVSAVGGTAGNGGIISVYNSHSTGKITTGGSFNAGNSSNKDAGTITVVSKSDLVNTANYSANSQSGKGGLITIRSTAGKLNMGGSADANSSAGLGGTILAESSQDMVANGTYAALSGAGTGGTVTLRSNAGTMNYSGVTTASSNSGAGGTVNVSGHSGLTSTGKIYANGKLAGAGGKINVGSANGAAAFNAGTEYEARGGATSGAGGEIKLSAKTRAQATHHNTAKFNSRPGKSGQAAGKVIKSGANNSDPRTCNHGFSGAACTP